MHRGFKIILWLLLIWSSYHIIRDIFQDLLNIHNPLIDFLRIEQKRDFSFLGTHHRLIGFFAGLVPLSGIILFSIKALKVDKFGLNGAIAVGLFASFEAFLAWLLISPIFIGIIWFLFLWSSYHLIRDLLADVLKLHHPIIDVWHMRPRHKEHILGKFYHFWGIPLEVGVFVLSINDIIFNSFSLAGILAVGLFATFVSFWIWSSF